MTQDQHGAELHRSESHFFISIMAVLRIILVTAYLYFEAKKIPLYSYMQTNWMGWPQYHKHDQRYFTGPIPVSRAIKKRLLELQPWNSFMLNLYSVQLLFVILLIKSIGQLWSHFLCVNFGLIENVFVFQL